MRIVLTILFLVNVNFVYSQKLNQNDLNYKADILCKDGRRKIAYSELKGDSLFVLFEYKIPIKGNNEELWLFSKEISKVILPGKQIEFSVSSNRKFIAFVDNGNDLSTNSGVTSILKIFDLVSNKVIQTTNISYIDAGLSTYGWSSKSDLFWLVADGAECYREVLAYNMLSKTLKRYNLPSLGGCYDYSINTDRKLLLYSDYVTGIDDGPMKANTKLHLIIYDFEKQEKKIIKENTGKDFKGIWINENSYEYYDSNLNKRKINKL